ncbi:MAG: hypothetical protein D6832_03015 [Alphaproteobacteria bacterium]|nr:MAG: hypothetical protein D6832_03015 [Alphaproteobacteria bacterium]
MAEHGEGWLERVAKRRFLERWRARADAAPQMELDALRRLRREARQLVQPLQRFLHHADGRLALPLAEHAEVRLPRRADWGWRPELWSGPIRPRGAVAPDPGARLGSEAQIFHDAAEPELTFRQLRNHRPEDVAPFGVALEVYRFAGSFLSLAIELPPAAIEGLTRQHIVAVETVIDYEAPIEMFLRLNIRHGPNTEQIVREIDMRTRAAVTDFDLAYSRINERRLERAWLDVIFEAPRMNAVVLRELAVTRRLRLPL